MNVSPKRAIAQAEHAIPQWARIPIFWTGPAFGLCGFVASLATGNPLYLGMTAGGACLSWWAMRESRTTAGGYGRADNASAGVKLNGKVTTKGLEAGVDASQSHETSSASGDNGSHNDAANPKALKPRIPRKRVANNAPATAKPALPAAPVEHQSQ